MPGLGPDPQESNARADCRQYRTRLPSSGSGWGFGGQELLPQALRCCDEVRLVAGIEFVDLM
jgi:hypothetical protein